MRCVGLRLVSVFWGCAKYRYERNTNEYHTFFMCVCEQQKQQVHQQNPFNIKRSAKGVDVKPKQLCVKKALYSK